MAIEFSDQHDDVRVFKGMEAQLLRLRERLSSGSSRIGWKIGFNGPVPQEQLGLCAPVVGYVPSDGLLYEGQVVPVEEGSSLFIEAEIGLVMGRELTGGEDVEAAQNAIASLVAAVELVEMNPALTELEAILEHNIFHRGVLFGTEQHEPGDVSLDRVAARVLRNGEETRALDPTLRPTNLGAIAKLVADTLAHHGEKLSPGERIISGSLIQPMRVRPGDVVEVEISPLGRLNLEFGR